MAGGLGRGLDSLLGGSTKENKNDINVRELEIEKIITNPNQPRKEFKEEALKELSKSIKEKGVLQPVLVRPISGKKDQFELVAGERRLRASKLAGLIKIPALIKEMTDLESMAIALIENLQREDLNPIEEAKGYQELISKFKLSQEELAKQVGKSRSALSNSMRLLTLNEKMQSSIAEGKISAGHGRSLMSVADDDLRVALYELIVSNGLSVREAEKCAAFIKENGSLPDGDLPKKKAKSKKVSKDERVSEIVNRLKKNLSLKVGVSGTKEKGKITINYKSEEELETIIAMLEVRS